MPVFTESKKGYDKDEVNNFIKQLNETTEARLSEKDAKIKELEDEIKRLTKKGTVSPEPKAENESAESADEAKKKYERLCADMGEKLLLAEVKASEIVEDANKKAELIIVEARVKANEQIETILNDAKLRAEGVKKAVDAYSAKEKEIMALLYTTEETFSQALQGISEHIYKG